MIYILYNPLANSGNGEKSAKEVQALQTEPVELHSIIDMDMREFLSGCSMQDTVILCGGDGTVNHFANDTFGVEYPCNIYLYKSGTGNDFLNDVKENIRDNKLLLNSYLKNLPTVEVKGKTYRFVNGIGYGIDGMVCEVADQMAAKGKKANYSLLSIKLLIRGYKCPNATVTVDGEKYSFRKVWLASGMNGRYYGGGMMVAPSQDRLGNKLSCCVVHRSSKLKTLMIFPSIFKGEHLKYKDNVTLLSGKEITVEFDIPTALQIDGETILGVSSYTIRK